MSIVGSPFEHCTAVEKDGVWYVSSTYWKMKMVSKSDAQRIAELLRFSYGVGFSDAQKEMRNALGIREYEGT